MPDPGPDPVAPHPAAGRAGPTAPTLTRTEIRLRLRPAGWSVEVALALGVAALTVSLRWLRPLTGFDPCLYEECDARRPPVAYWLPRAVNLVGNGGWIMTVVLLLAVRRRTVRPLLAPVAAAILSTGAPTIWPVSHWVSCSTGSAAGCPGRRCRSRRCWNGVRRRSPAPGRDECAGQPTYPVGAAWERCERRQQTSRRRGICRLRRTVLGPAAAGRHAARR
ncbi:hypothetical protein Asera_04760 [Actinocatenispora sera]|uniref:Uncharacterized protein n=1 Tax=Actinocatenispora sera TaxID=390989 RepID=A0A810KWB0_9ACTN|nr:hypothetical protein Asera_04760 [Actinocatenispora sera]